MVGLPSLQLEDGTFVTVHVIIEITDRLGSSQLGDHSGAQILVMDKVVAVGSGSIGELQKIVVR